MLVPRIRQLRGSVLVRAAAIAIALFAPALAQGQTTGLNVYQPGIENQIWQQLSYVGSGTCAADPNTGACPPAPPAPDTSLGKYYFPIQIATDVLPTPVSPTCLADPYIVNYVTDQWNQRVQAFDYCGNPVAFTNAPNGWPTIGGGVPGHTMAAGGGAFGLNNPEGIVVDAAHNIIIGDRDNARIAIFRHDGSFLFEIPVTPLSQPTGVAVLPGTVMDSTGGGHGWVAVALSAFGMSKLQVYDSRGTLIGENPEPEGSTLPGSLQGPGGVAVDSAGRIYVADLYNSRIAGYSVDTVAKTVTYRFAFASDPASLPVSQLQNPYSIAFDQLGRLIVGDTGNQRLAVFTTSFASAAALTPTSVRYKFYLDARGDLNGYPRGVAQDQQGRLYAVDTANHRVQRFEMPKLAVVDLSTTPAGLVPSGAQFTVTAGFAVPAAKVAVRQVTPAIVASANVTPVSGPAPVAPSPAAPTPLINPGEIAYYSWTYAAGFAGGTASFTIGATGNSGNVSAPTKTIAVSLGCAGCETTPPATTATVSSAKTYLNWHSSPATVSLSAVDAANIGKPSGVREIRLYLTGIQSSPSLGLPQCAQQFGNNIEYCITAPPATVTFSKSIALNIEGTTTVWFRSVDNDGNIEAEKSIAVTIDASAPVVNFVPTPATPASGWYGTPTPSVTVNYTVTDVNGSGVGSKVTTPGSLTFTQEGVTTQTVSVVDNVGNSATAPFSVSIDRTPPTITPVAGRTVELATTAGTSVTLALTAGDALSGMLSVSPSAPNVLFGSSVVAGTRSSPSMTNTVTGVFPLGTTTVTITATDVAGNQSTGTTTVTVRDTTPPAITFVPAPVTISTTPLAGTAPMPALAAQVVATDLNGPVTVTQSPGANTALNPGVYTVTFTAKDAAGNASTRTTSVTVHDGTPPTITACAPPATASLDPTTNLATVPNMTGGVTAIDNSGGLLSVTQAPAAGTTLGLGTHAVAFMVADASGNVASCSSTLTVVAVPPPTATIALTPGVLWPPNHKLVPVTATLTISDPNAAVQLVSITSSEPDLGLGDGDKPIDEQTLSGQPIAAAYGTDTRQFLLRAERSGRGPGRVYTVTYRVSNIAGSILMSGVVLVPHDMSVEARR